MELPSRVCKLGHRVTKHVVESPNTSRIYVGNRGGQTELNVYINDFMLYKYFGLPYVVAGSLCCHKLFILLS